VHVPPCRCARAAVYVRVLRCFPRLIRATPWRPLASMWQSGGLARSLVREAETSMARGVCRGVGMTGPSARHLVLRRLSSTHPAAPASRAAVLAFESEPRCGRPSGFTGGEGPAMRVWEGGRTRWGWGGCGTQGFAMGGAHAPTGCWRPLSSAAGQRAAGAGPMKPSDNSDDDGDSDGDPNTAKPDVKKKKKESKVELTLATVRAKKEDELANLNYSTLVEDKPVEIPKVCPLPHPSHSALDAHLLAFKMKGTSVCVCVCVCVAVILVMCDWWEQIMRAPHTTNCAARLCLTLARRWLSTHTLL
jgi:hypothetical protein